MVDCTAANQSVDEVHGTCGRGEVKATRLDAAADSRGCRSPQHVARAVELNNQVCAISRIATRNEDRIAVRGHGEPGRVADLQSGNQSRAERGRPCQDLEHRGTWT